MTQTEYDRKKRECWEEFCDEHLFDPHNIVTQGIFGYAFDRAYALGKQEIKQENDAENGIDLKKLDKMLDDTLEKETTESLNQWLSEKEPKSMCLSDVKQKIDAWMNNHTEEDGK